MARWEKAKWEPVNFHDVLEDRAADTVDVVDFHTNGGGADVRDWFDEEYAKTHQRVGSHFQILKDGTPIQLADTDKIIYAAYGLSRRAIEVETEDDGHPENPWTPAQLATFHALVEWARSVHPKIGIHLLQNANDAGISYHQQFSEYNQSGHNCPGPTRVSQLIHTVIPRLGEPAKKEPTGSHAPRPVGKLPLPQNHYDEDTVRWQQQMNHRGWRLRVDGVFGKACHQTCLSFQAEKKLHQSGVVDQATWSATWTAPITR